MKLYSNTVEIITKKNLLFLFMEYKNYYIKMVWHA